MKRVCGGVLALSILVAVFVGTRQSTWQLAGDLLISTEEPHSSDAIVVMGGDFWGPRVVHGAELGKARFASRVIISGPPYRDRPESELAIEFLQTKGYPRELFISFAHTATSTPDEILVLCDELHRRSIKNILLVTDSYHSRRSQITFNVLCPSIRVTSSPAQDPYYRPAQWWTRPADQDIVRREWTKIAGTVVLAPRYWLLPVSAQAAARKQNGTESGE